MSGSAASSSRARHTSTPSRGASLRRGWTRRGVTSLSLPISRSWRRMKTHSGPTSIRSAQLTLTSYNDMGPRSARSSTLSRRQDAIRPRPLASLRAASASPPYRWRRKRTVVFATSTPPPTSASSLTDQKEQCSLPTRTPTGRCATRLPDSVSCLQGVRSGTRANGSTASPSVLQRPRSWPLRRQPRRFSTSEASSATSGCTRRSPRPSTSTTPVQKSSHASSSHARARATSPGATSRSASLRPTESCAWRASLLTITQPTS